MPKRLMEKRLTSAMIRRIAADDNGLEDGTADLEVEFSNGTIWKYRNVPKGTITELSLSESAGKTFHAKIKSKYDGEKISQ